MFFNKNQLIEEDNQSLSSLNDSESAHSDE